MSMNDWSGHVRLHQFHSCITHWSCPYITQIANIKSWWIKVQWTLTCFFECIISLLLLVKVWNNQSPTYSDFSETSISLQISQAGRICCCCLSEYTLPFSYCSHSRFISFSRLSLLLFVICQNLLNALFICLIFPKASQTMLL